MQAELHTHNLMVDRVVRDADTYVLLRELKLRMGDIVFDPQSGDQYRDAAAKLGQALARMMQFH